MKRTFLILPLVFLLAECSFARRIAIRQVVDVIEDSRWVFERETDLELAESALSANLKLLEVMSAQDPNNRSLNLFLAEIYSVYSLSFVEDKMEEYEFSNPDLADYHRKRAVNFYLRARMYAQRVLQDEIDADPVKLSPEELKKKLEKLDKGDVAGAFWYFFAWGSAINLSRDDMDQVAHLSKVEIGISRVKKLKDDFYFGGAYLLEGVYFGARSPMMGGDMDRSGKAFDQGDNLMKKKFLMFPYFRARTYCVFTQNAQCFDENLKRVIEAPEDIFPEQALAGQLARKKARRLLSRREEYFIE